jgi:uncharacterized membrane protein YcaP (DUF421 family)
MNMIARGVVMYVLIWFIFRVSGRRTMSDMTTFDFVLLLICGEVTQQALLGNDYSITNATIVLLTIVCADRSLALLRTLFPRLDRVVEGLPLLIMVDGKPLRDRMRRERIDEQDILHQARRSHGIDKLQQVKHAILESSGEISIIPRDPR